MLDFTKEDFLRQYDDLKRIAAKCFENSDLESSLKYIEICAKLGYNSNFFYTDNEIENLIFNISQKINTWFFEDFISIKGKYALIDTNGSDNHGLTQQYIRAFINANIEFIYIYGDTDLNRIKIIQEEIAAYPKGSIFTFEREYSYVEKIKLIEKLIFDYKPEKYLMHIMPWDVVAITICNILKNVIRYNINATDHAYWLGASCIEYCIEFRSYGCSVSLDKRGLKREQLLLLPYYPIVNKTNFNGFPEEISESSIKVFSGGSYYKIYGENNVYFDLIKQFLISNDNVVLLFAGTGNNSIFEKFINSNNLHTRIFLLGNRSDINEVYESCDFYLGTYPLCGGLMSQYASYNSKPILAYTNDKLPVNFIEGFVCHQSKHIITRTSIPEFLAYGNKLCEDPEFRYNEGKELKKCLITPELFNDEFKYLMSNNKSKRDFVQEIIDYDVFSTLYLEVENKYLHDSQLLIGSTFRLNLLFRSPKIFINILIFLSKRFLRKKKLV
ncbi:hypothetical protein L0669_01725 [Flavobacterium bizetiae]|uniref:hypothetical protein n=1 Tax=Flavobacterium bizetiae TaxID=2704140 RepID=UPI0021E75194|nr:hypothetical protein [Flavobacterium bizetiae]UTN04634.1 hypothetical protein L0669_01725 [Flavobacterium bizetiae]